MGGWGLLVVSTTNVKGWSQTDHGQHHVSKRRQHRLDFRFQADVRCNESEPNVAYKRKYIRRRASYHDATMSSSLQLREFVPQRLEWLRTIGRCFAAKHGDLIAV